MTTTSPAEASGPGPGVRSRPAPGVRGRPQAGQVLASLARRLADLDFSDPTLSDRATRLAGRTESGTFHVAVLGDFKRGKSTLVNALVGRPVLPTGVVPVTTVATEVRFGAAPSAIVVLDDGRRLAITEGDIATYVSESANPGNRRRVRRVEVGVEAVLGAPGLVLVDTPGVASVHRHQSAAAGDALADSDGAVVVLSADSPLSTTEEALLFELAQRRARVFVVVNKCDHLDQAGREEVRAYVAAHVRRLLGEGEPYLLAARPAPGGPAPGPGFVRLRDDLAAFVRDDLAAARHAATMSELARLGASLGTAAALESAAAAVDLATLDRRAHLFAEAAGESRRRFDEDRLVLDREVEMLAAGESWPQMVSAAGGVPLARLDRVLDAALSGAVQEAFEPLRRSAESQAEAGWTDLAGRFGRRLQERVDDLREKAGELFELHLPSAPVPSVTSQPVRFTYQFLRVESPGTAAARAIALLVPIGARARLLRRARRRLAGELDKHAGRARHDLALRLQAARDRFAGVMSQELEETERSVVATLDRVIGTRAARRGEDEARRAARSAAAALAAEIAARVADGGSGSAGTGDGGSDSSGRPAGP
ncbi:MAG: dynamin family protein [Acidimicrobiales bacterium]